MPTTIQGSNRQTVTAKNGSALSRQYVYMPEATWELLRRLCVEQDRPGSLVLQSLVTIAALGIQKETNGTNISR